MDLIQSTSSMVRVRLEQPAFEINGVTDEQLIHYGTTEAPREARPIDHATVRPIASQLYGGQRSPLYALASSGHWWMAS